MLSNLRRKTQIHESYQKVFGTPDGQRVLRHLMKVGNVLTSSFAPGDPHVTAFKEGQRHIVLSMLRFVNKDHDELVKAMEQELQKANEDII